VEEGILRVVEPVGTIVTTVAEADPLLTITVAKVAETVAPAAIQKLLVKMTAFMCTTTTDEVSPLNLLLNAERQLRHTPA
jgi:hypothetical protein